MDQLRTKLVNSGLPFKFLNTRDTSYGPAALKTRIRPLTTVEIYFL